MATEQDPNTLERPEPPGGPPTEQPPEPVGATTHMTDAGSTAPNATAAPRKLSPWRRVLLVLLFLASCLAIVTSTVVIWVHQVALNTDRWVAVVGPVIDNPQVVDAMSVRIADQVVTTLKVQERIEAALPGPAEVVAVPITNAVEAQIQERLARAMSGPRFRDVWFAANRIAHQQIVRILRGESQTIVVDGDYVRLDLWPLVGIALQELQSAGIIPSSITLPDLSQGLPEGAGGRLEQALGITLPPDFGTVPLMPADRLLAAQRAVRLFDLAVVALLLLSVALIAVTVWYAPRRRWMLVYLGFGAAVSLLLARFAIQSLEGSIVASFADADTASTIRGVLHAALDNMYAFTRIVVLAGIGLAVIAYLAGRPAWLGAVSGRAVGVTRQAASGAGAATTAAMSGGASRESATSWARAHQAQLRWVGLGAIVFVLAWAAVGIEIALLGLALVVLVEAGIALLGGTKGEMRADEPPETGPTG